MQVQENVMTSNDLLVQPAKCNHRRIKSLNRFGRPAEASTNVQDPERLPLRRIRVWLTRSERWMERNGGNVFLCLPAGLRSADKCFFLPRDAMGMLLLVLPVTLFPGI